MTEERIYYSREAEQQAMREMTRLTLIYAALGLSIGAGLALLFAPSSGQKIRMSLSKTLEEGLNRGQEAVEPLFEQIHGQVDDLRETVGDRIGSLR